jgi:AcrR family transcriptional regulator
MKDRRRKRSYRQESRAEAAEETGRRIVAAFGELAREQWYDEITLDAVARDAEVTVQTVIRRFANKAGLLDALFERTAAEITARRVPEHADVVVLVASVVDDYEQFGDSVLRMLAQEARWPAVRSLVERGRVEHRRWVNAAFGSMLAGSAARKRECVDGLVVATDVYTWKLLRRDMGRSRQATERMMVRLVRGAIAGEGENDDE